MSANPEDPTGLVANSLKDPVSQSVQAVFDSVNRGVEALDPLGTYATAQKNRIKAANKNVKLLGMHDPIDLSSIYFPTQISTTIGRRLYKQEWLAANAKSIAKSSIPTRSRKAMQSGDEYFHTHRRIVVLGGPGAGKTTFLKFLALAYADDEIRKTTALSEALIPFFVSLPQFVRQKTHLSLFEYLSVPIKEATTSHASAFLKRLLVNGQAAVFLDSLDEVPKSARQAVIEQIKEFEVAYPNAYIAMSCRTADYEEVLLNFHEVEIARLTKDAIGKIVKAWFGEDRQHAKQLLQIIDNDDGVATLTETPLLLSLLCIQFRHDLALPKRKVELYRRCVDTLLRDWDVTRGFRRETAYEAMSDDRKERLFEHIAGRFFLPQESYEFKREEIIPCVASFIEKVGLDPKQAEEVLREIECHHGIIEKFSQDEYCFSHTSLQDYFLAKHLISKGKALDYISINLENEAWEPTIEFAVALAEEPRPILELIMKKSAMPNLSNYPPMARRTRILWLLYRCMAAAPFVDRAFAKAVFEHLVQTQIDIARIYRAGGVFPIAELEEGGVRHPFLWTHKRTTLATALQPFRKFANEILMSPMGGYAEEVLQEVKKLQDDLPKSGHDLLARDALLISLLVPLASAVPHDVLKYLTEIKDRQQNTFIAGSLSRSIRVLSVV